MRPKVVLFFSLLLLAAVGWSQEKLVNVSFPSNGDREVWLAAKRGAAPPADSTMTSSNVVKVPVGSHGTGESVFVWDKASGNLAVRPLKDVLKSGLWNVEKADFNSVAMVTIHLEQGGKPAPAGDVTLSDGLTRPSELLDPSANGDVKFFDVKPGSLEVTVRYKSGGQMAKPVRQLFDLALERSEPIPVFQVALAGEASPAGTPATPHGEGAEAGDDTEKIAESAERGNKKLNEGNPFGSFVVILIGLVVVGGIVYGIWRYTQQNTDLVQAQLQKMGVQIPTPNPVPDDVAAVAPIPAKPEPVQKIILDDAAPGPVVPGPMAVVQVPAGPVANPRLVGTAGDEMPIPEGETVVGREVGLGLSLVGETSVSRRHAQIVNQGGVVTVQDLGSTNGTYVNNTPAVGPQTLRVGDTVQFGTVKFRFEG